MRAKSSRIHWESIKAVWIRVRHTRYYIIRIPAMPGISGKRDLVYSANLPRWYDNPTNLIEDCAVAPEELPAYIRRSPGTLLKSVTQVSHLIMRMPVPESYGWPNASILKQREGRGLFRQIL